MSLSPAPTVQATPFPLSAVKITGGPFEQAHIATAKYLLEVDPERLLAGFRANAGIATTAKIYGGWETGGLSGHSAGHYLTACAQEYARTKDERYRAKVTAIVKGLKECQEARKDGFICAFRFDNGFDPKKLDGIWSQVSRGELRSGGFDLNGMWSPWYVHHKVFAGLLDAQELCGDPDALDVAKKFGDWAVTVTKDLSPTQWQTMLGTEWGGMNDSLAELYRRTNDSRYLDLSRKFYDSRVLEPLSRGEDNLSGKHSNTQIPKLIGLARLYDVTGNASDRKTSEFFWDRVVNHHSYVIGGNSNGEYLGPPDKLSDRLSSNTCETCNTYNMLKLTRELFTWSPRAELMDFYERAYVNHILASQDPASGMVTYFVPLGMGAQRNFSNKFNDFTCCHGSGMENHTKHGDSTYFHEGGKTLWVNLFMPTQLTWKEAGLTITQETQFPYDNKVVLTVQGNASSPVDFKLRHPAWATGKIDYLINGKRVASSDKPGSYVSVSRRWKSKDRLSFALPMTLHSESMPDNKNRIAVLYGPVVLAATLAAPGNTLVQRTPVIISKNRRVSEWLKPVAGKPLHFVTKDAARPNELTFAPFFGMVHERHGVYFDVFTQPEWETKEAEYRAAEDRIRDIESRTIDSMVIGEMQPERDHNLTSDRNDVREANGRSFRTPLNNGWFEFDLKADPSVASELIFTYWGNDLGKPSFEISVNGVKIATEDLAGKPKNQFFDVSYELPLVVTQGKSSVRVRVAALPGQRGGSVSGARLVRKKVS